MAISASIVFTGCIIPASLEQTFGESSIPIYYGNLDKIAGDNDLVFSAWGGPANKMFIREVDNGTGKMFRVQGTADSSAAGFVCGPLNYSSQNITLSIGNVSTFSDSHPLFADNEAQISFKFHLIHQTGELASISYVIGKMYAEEGWNGNHYFKKIGANYSDTVTLPDEVILKGITLGVQGNVTVNPVDFTIKL